MAQKHNFEKLWIGKPPQDRRIESSFASLSLRHDDDELASTIPLSPPNSDGNTAATPYDDHLGVKSSEEDLSKRLWNGEDIEASRSSEETAISSLTSDISAASLQDFQRRKTSINFADEITTSDGDKKMLEEPMARSAPRMIPSHIQNGVQETDWQPAVEGERYAGNERVDSLEEQAIDIQGNGLSTGGWYTRGNGMATRESLSTNFPASPVSEGLLTPIDAVLSASPIQSSAPETDSQPIPWPSRRSETIRSRSYQRLEKAGGRRRSTRSANSSISPASAFLSQWSRSNVPEESEPDDEGQEISDSGWIIGRKIGYGGFSVVREVSTFDNRSGKRIVRAVKIVRKRPTGIRDEQQNDNIQSDFEREVALWRYLKNRYIVPLIAVYESNFATFCITKLNIGGTLHDLIRSRRQQYKDSDRGLSAPLAKRYTYQIAAALRYLHEDVRVVHRDIKLENCLLDMTAPDAASQGGNILICDFGMADYIYNEAREDPPPDEDAHNIGPAASSSRLTGGSSTPADLGNRDTTLTIMGSLEYASPEVVTATATLFSTKADIWAFGVCVYALLTGSLPFSHSMREKLALMIEKSQWDITPLYTAPAVRGQGPAGMSVIDLVKGCLTYDNEDRWNIGEVLEARWLLNCKELYGDGTLSDEEMEEWKR